MSVFYPSYIIPEYGTERKLSAPDILPCIRPADEAERRQHKMLIDLIKARHSVRKYTDRQVSREDLEKILEAGSCAPSAGGGQLTMMAGVRDRKLVKRIGMMNVSRFDRNAVKGLKVSSEQPSIIDDPKIADGFYGAPCVVCIFAQNDYPYRVADAFCIAENILLQATELGISSCIAARGDETFAAPEGQEILRSWGIPEDYTAVCFTALGYIDGAQPQSKPRRPGRVMIIEE